MNDPDRPTDVDDEITRQRTQRDAPGSGDTVDSAEPSAAEAPTAARPRYRMGEIIGRGGMGEVVLAHDDRVGRPVALKRMHRGEHDTEAIARFLREAKIQARLEHPSIVPVHDLGNDSDGRPYFTMKRLSGTTLRELLKRPATTLQRLLRVFVDVCSAIELAHSRGVVHRDLKPSNIMVGDFGEVYVLDWGIARVVDRDPHSVAVATGPTTFDDQTRTGTVIGTPGYMAPEQARGEAVGPACDVYSLGAMLFEILTREPLHPPGTAGMLASRPESPVQRAAARGVPPELDLACTAALAVDPSARPTARILGERVQLYLDGDRDLELRRSLAAEQLALARAAAASGDPARRAEAMQTAGRALALDPESREAAALVSSLILEPPAESPPALQAALAAIDGELVLRQRRAASISVASYFLFFPIVLWMGIEDWTAVLSIFALVAIVVGAARIAVWRRQTTMTFALVSHAVLIAMMSRVVGPFVLLPALAGVAVMALIASPSLMDRKWTVIGAMMGTIVVPVLLERFGVLASTWSVDGDRLIITSQAVALEVGPATAFLLASNLALIMFTGLFAWSLAATRRDAIRRAESQAWHLSQLLPRT